MYDILIIGAGVNGAIIARNLAKYELNILVLEKENDVGNGTSAANSAIIHSGYDPLPSTLKAKLNRSGNQQYDQICRDLDVQFERIGSLTLATTPEEEEMLMKLISRTKENMVDVTMLIGDEIRQVEPYATKNARKGIFAKSAGIINPFELVVALMENAIDNGVTLHLNEEVTDIIREKGYYQVITSKNSYQAKIVINAAGLYSDVMHNFVFEKKIHLRPRKGQYFVLDHFVRPYLTHTLFGLPSERGKGVLVTPTTHHNYLVGPSSDFVKEKDDVGTDKEILDQVLTEARKLVDDLPMSENIRQYSGLRAYYDTDDFLIEEHDGFIDVLGIQSPGLASAPATADLVESFVQKLITLRKKDSYYPKRRPMIRLKEKPIAEQNRLISENPQFGNIICRCESISEGEVVDCIHRSCGATTIKGVKKRVRPGAGRCQGGFCEELVMHILARELNIDLKDVRYDTEKSYILLKETKGGADHEGI